ncbi:RCC1 domain-containing protein 1-like [Ctenocephalides felis]|uniref:RCC1 domain-containing protein 1-like n=1 Tax=Ctenocephalides felis TaxID=7515 RepID=UPI000E6E1CA6|nr:RCC1 domain-containing protein 1-like [Ctenocephalides felis]
MKLLYCGFNGFKQIPHENIIISKLSTFAYKNNSEYELETVSKIHYNKYVTNNVPCKSEVVQYLCAGHFLTAIVSLDNNLYKTPKEARASVDGTVIDISSGFEHTLLLTAEGKVYSWGVGSRGQLGHGEISNERFPRLVEALDGIQISKISAGGWHSCAVGILGELYTWGWNEKGQLGLPIPKSSLKSLQKSIATETDSFNVFQISSGNRHTVILGNDMKLYGTGWNKYQELRI